MHTFLKRLLVISISVCKLLTDTLLNVKSERKNSCNIFEGFNHYARYNWCFQSSGKNTISLLLLKKIDSRETICNWSKGNNS